MVEVEHLGLGELEGAVDDKTGNGVRPMKQFAVHAFSRSLGERELAGLDKGKWKDDNPSESPWLRVAPCERAGIADQLIGGRFSCFSFKHWVEYLESANPQVILVMLLLLFFFCSYSHFLCVFPWHFLADVVVL